MTIPSDFERRASRSRASPLAVLAMICSASCVTYRNSIPQITHLTDAELNQTWQLSAHARQVRLATLIVDLPLGYDMGESDVGVDGACTMRSLVINRDGRVAFDHPLYTEAFYSVMKAHGYPVDDRPELFEGSKDRIADLQVAGRIVELKLNDCRPNAGYKGVIHGSAYLKVEWSIYSMLEKKVIATIATEGSTYQEVETPLSRPGYLRVAVADAVHRLALSSHYREAIDPPR